MKFSIVEKALRIECESSPEVIEALKHYRMEIADHIEEIAAGRMVIERKPGRDNGEYFAVSTHCGAEWLAPYFDKIERITGWRGPLPEIEAPRYPGGYAVNLQHTHIVERATISSSGYTAHGYMHAADWNGRKAAERYQGLFDRYIRESLGDTKREPEFLPVGNGGLMRHNPNYLRQHAPHAACTSALIFGVIFQYWLENVASPAQREIVARADATHRQVCPRDTMPEFLIRSYEPGFRVDWSAPLVSFDTFKGL